MWWTVLALLPGSYADMVRGPAEMRFCAAASQQVEAETAKQRGTNSDEVRMHRPITEAFLTRLRELGAADDGALAATRKALGHSDQDQTRYGRCGTLAMGLADDGGLVKAATTVDAAVEEAMATAPAVEDDAPSAAKAAMDADEATTNYARSLTIDGAPLLAALSEPRRGEVRCAVIANLIRYEFNRGASKRDYGLSEAQAETLAGRLAEAIITETGVDSATVRAINKADYEAFTFALLGDDQDEATILSGLQAAVDRCRPLYDSIDLSGPGDGVVKGLSPAAMLGGAAAPDPAQCYAIMAHFLPGLAKGSKEATAFGDIVARLELRHYAEKGQTVEAAADLAAAVATFDDAAFEALPEAAAETQMGYCMDLAGQ